MSYSFNVTSPTKADALKAVETAMAEVVKGQPIHARDQAQVQANAVQAVELLSEDSTKDIVVSCNGSLGWSGGAPGAETLTSVTINVSTWLGERKA